MFRKLFSWFRGGEEQYDLYKPSQKKIYAYWNGREEIQADPIMLYKRMMVKGPELSIDLKVADSSSKDAAKAHDAAIVKIQEIFSLKPYENGGGLTQTQQIELLEHFLIYCEWLKKNSRKSQTTLTPTEDFKPTSAENQPTLNTLDSGSIGSEPSTAGRMSLHLEPVSPSEHSSQE